MKRTAFYLSDGTGITAETLGHSMLSQFGDIEFVQITLPFVQSDEQTREAIARINRASVEDGQKPVVFSTLVNNDHRTLLHGCDGLVLDLFGAFLNPLEDELGVRSSHKINQSHAIRDAESYRIRINAVHFALDNDDGARVPYADKADLLLVGVARCGKTPTCLYMAMQFGIRAANYPRTEDDMEHLTLPAALRAHQHKLFGLTIDPDRLTAIRNERKPNSRYSSYAQCEFEVREVENLFRRENIAHINSTHFSVEEISAKILVEKGVERRFK